MINEMVFKDLLYGLVTNNSKHEYKSHKECKLIAKILLAARSESNLYLNVPQGVDFYLAILSSSETRFNHFERSYIAKLAYDLVLKEGTYNEHIDVFPLMGILRS